MKKIKTMLISIAVITVMTQSIFAADIPLKAIPTMPQMKALQ